MGIKEIVQQYQPLHPVDVHDALAYAYDHLDELENDLQANDEATVQQIELVRQTSLSFQLSTLDRE